MTLLNSAEDGPSFRGLSYVYPLRLQTPPQSYVRIAVPVNR